MHRSNYNRYKRQRRKNNLKTFVYIILLFIIGFGAAFFFTNSDFSNTTLSGFFIKQEEVIETPPVEVLEPEPEPTPEPEPEPEPEIFELNSLYFDVTLVDDETYLDEILSKTQDGTINAVVIPLKNRDGSFNYVSELSYKTVSLIGTDLTEIISTLQSIEDLYLIADVSMYGDDHYAYNYTTTAVKASGTNTFYDYSSERWITPYSEEGHTYLSEVLLEVNSLGFDEIMMSNFSFPAQGKLSYIHYNETDIAKEDILTVRVAEFKEILGDTPLSVNIMPETLLEDAQTYEDIDAFSEILDMLYFDYVDDTTVSQVEHIENKGFILYENSNFVYSNYILK